MAYQPVTLFRLTLRQRCRGQSCFNVFHYANAAGTSYQFAGSMNVIGSAFRQLVLDQLRIIQSTQVLSESLLIEQLVGGDSFFDYPLYNTTGTLEGELVNLFTAYSFVSPRKTRTIRAGHKRFVGVIEAHSSNGTITPNLIAPSTVIAASMSSTLTAGDGVNVTELVPVIASFFDGPNPRPAPLVDKADYTLQGYTSQVSRKRRGLLV